MADAGSPGQPIVGSTPPGRRCPAGRAGIHPDAPSHRADLGAPDRRAVPHHRRSRRPESPGTRRCVLGRSPVPRRVAERPDGPATGRRFPWSSPPPERLSAAGGPRRHPGGRGSIDRPGRRLRDHGRLSAHRPRDLGRPRPPGPAQTGRLDRLPARDARNARRIDQKPARLAGYISAASQLLLRDADSASDCASSPRRRPRPRGAPGDSVGRTNAKRPRTIKNPGHDLDLAGFPQFR